MKKQLYFVFVLANLVAFSLSAFAAPTSKKSRAHSDKNIRKESPVRSTPVLAEPVSVQEAVSVKAEKPADWKSLTRTEKKEFKTEMRNRIKNVKDAKHGDDQVIALILAIFLAPFGILYWEGATTIFWVDLILWVLGVGLVWSPFFYIGGLWLIATIIAIVVVLS